MARTPMEGVPTSCQRFTAPSSDTTVGQSTIGIRAEGAGSLYLKGSQQDDFVQNAVAVGDWIPGNWVEVGASTDVAFVAFYRS